LTKHLIGTGGWAYFHIPGLNSLEAYSKIFNFVEINSTFYILPSLKMVESWRRRAPPDFEFSVRLNRAVTHKHEMEPNEESFRIIDYTKQICRTLGSKTIVIQTPETIEYDDKKIKAIEDLFSSVDLNGLRIAWEIRQRDGKLPKPILNLMQENNVIHCVDLSKEEPAYQTDQVYTRLFGKGEHNIYQFSDEELKEIGRKTDEKEYNKVTASFHNVKMYKDAARYKTYRETEKLPPITRYTGLESLKSVLREDSKFPTSKEALIKHQGWKLIDLTEERRTHAKELLQKLEEKTYKNIDEIIRQLK
jgi:uncharacterized protein YecE (DUF72 family)